MEKDPKRYDIIKRADDDYDAYLEARAFHTELNEADVRVSLAIVHDEDGMKLRGINVIAMVRITPERDRAHGLEDAQILIDAGSWSHADYEERVAIFDHELTHLIVNVDKFGKVKTDGADRPKLSMRLHDQEFGWFNDVAARHKGKSIEVQQARHLFDKQGQTYLPGFVASVRQEASRSKRKAQA